MMRSAPRPAPSTEWCSYKAKAMHRYVLKSPEHPPHASGSWWSNPPQVQVHALKPNASHPPAHMVTRQRRVLWGSHSTSTKWPLPLPARCSTGMLSGAKGGRLLTLKCGQAAQQASGSLTRGGGIVQQVARFGHALGKAQVQLSFNPAHSAMHHPQRHIACAMCGKQRFQQ